MKKEEGEGEDRRTTVQEEAKQKLHSRCLSQRQYLSGHKPRFP